MSSQAGPVLLTYTTKDLWDFIHPVAIIGWLFLLIAPVWKRALVFARVPPLLYAILYAIILVPKILTDEGDPPDINKMESIQKLFEDPDTFFCGWVHYLAFDLLVGAGIVEDAIGLPLIYFYLCVVPCLFMTFYLGPVGLLLYTCLKWTVLPMKEDSMVFSKARKNN